MKVDRLVYLSPFYLCLTFLSNVNAQTNDSIDQFLKNHWPQGTIPLQGKPPINQTFIENDLSPEACGQCHVKQFEEWQHSIHSKTMGPGVLGQMLTLQENDPQTAHFCWQCHTPLAEQQPVLIENGQPIRNKQYNKSLNRSGLVCAACHVRNHQRFGPPRKSEENREGTINNNHLPHNGFIATQAFGDSRFCAHCHQFSENDFALNGKLLENTYQEWLQSRYSDENIHCQDCHMPERKHSWAGIHDKTMVKKAISINTSEIKYENNGISININIKNTGAGHYFPTYVTPKVEISAVQLNEHHEEIEHTRRNAFIGREITNDLSEEVYDTRIAPDDFAEIVYRMGVDPDAAAIIARITVHPDHFYERFFRTSLQGDLSKKAESLFKQAHDNSLNSSFDIFEQHWELDLTQVTQFIRREKRKDISTVASQKQHTVDWNDNNIQWLDYESATSKAKNTGKPIILILYADWCPTCHSYKSFFYTKKVIELTKKFIMARANVDKRTDISAKFALDGEYVPRIIALNSNGKLQLNTYPKSKKPLLFFSANTTDSIIDLMNHLQQNNSNSAVSLNE